MTEAKEALQEEKKGIKEIKELFAATELLIVSSLDIAKGGFDQEDIAKGLELLKKINVIVEGFKGLGELPAEFKDLDQTEILELAMLGYNLAQAIIKAVAALKAE